MADSKYITAVQGLDCTGQFFFFRTMATPMTWWIPLPIESSNKKNKFEKKNIGRIHLPLMDEPCIKCVIKKPILFFIRILWNFSYLMYVY